MKANEARELADSIDSPIPTAIVQAVYHNIREAATTGKRSIVFARPNCVNHGDWMANESKVRRQLAADGYDMVDHKFASSPDPREHDWTDIRW